MVPLRPTTKGSQSRSLSITNRALSSTSSSKRSVESASFTNNYSDDLDDEMGREKTGSSKASKLSENNIKHHNKKSPSSKITIFESMCMKYISKFESKNWR